MSESHVITLKKTKIGKVWDLLHELGVQLPVTGQVNIEVHLKDSTIKDVYVTTREKIQN